MKLRGRSSTNLAQETFTKLQRKEDYSDKRKQEKELERAGESCKSCAHFILLNATTKGGICHRKAKIRNTYNLCYLHKRIGLTK